MKLIFVRHGDPDYERDSLTERGWKEAEALVPRVKRWQADGLYCSPLGRAQDTARTALAGKTENLVTLDWLREFHVPILDPVTQKERIPWDFMPAYWTQFEELYDRDDWVNAPVMKTGEVAKRNEQVKEGIDALLKQYGYLRNGRYYVTEEGNDKTLVFFCHLGVQFVVLSHLLGLSAAVLWQNFFVAPTSVTVVETEEREKGNVAFRCRKLGDTSHLYDAGIEPSKSGFFQSVFE